MKKKLLIISLLTMFMVTAVNASDIKLDTEKLHEITASTKVLQSSTLQIKEGIDKDSVYFLKLEARSQRGSQIITAFLDKKTGAIYFGNGYDKEGNIMAFPKDINIIKEGVAFSYGNGKKEIYLVTDPECPYCTKFEKATEGKLGDYTVHVIFYPLPFHKKAPAMIEWIMQAKSDVEKRERLINIAFKKSTEYQSLIKDTKKPFQYSTSTQEVVRKSLKAVQELGTQGTPTTYDAEFNKIPWVNLVKLAPQANPVQK
ncbi:thioredoxin fold domain-containing protein [Sulfurovum sp.]|uniref:thioredoxin fold domain-containing protein n=1 Tax=Sulfurovum sp. TaxID=1969726 RepID=UPI003564FAC1